MIIMSLHNVIDYMLSILSCEISRNQLDKKRRLLFFQFSLARSDKLPCVVIGKDWPIFQFSLARSGIRIRL